MSESGQHWDRLLGAYLEGTIGVEALLEIETLLLADDEFVDYASRWCLMDRQVAELLDEDALHEMMDRFAKGAAVLPKRALSTLAESASDEDCSACTHLGLVETSRRFVRRRLPQNMLVLTAAAVALVSIGATLWYDAKRVNVEAELVDSTAFDRLAPPAVDSDDVFATVTRLVDCVWTPGAKQIPHGAQLTALDRIRLDAGMVKVTFECGAEVVVEGPCDFAVESQMLGVLKSGKITANVPRRAFGFAILSPRVDFVDLGTSFGLTVDGDGRAELHVFDGEVLCSQNDVALGDTNDAIHVRANNAIEFHTEGNVPTDIAMNESQFGSLISMRRGAAAPGLVVGDDLVLWLAADGHVSTDESGRVLAWEDILYGENESAEDALQTEAASRPQLVDDAVNGLPAIRFDGQSDFLLTTPLETTDDQTVLLVCQFSPAAFDPDRRWGSQILNYDGPPSRYLSNLLEPGVLQIGEPLLERQYRPSLLTAQVFAGFIGSATVEAGRVDGAEVGPLRPIVLAYRYDYGNRVAELRINDRSFGQQRAFAPQGITSRKIIGRHAWMQNFFNGDLAELLIYNRAITPVEQTAVTAYLADKYAIAMDADFDAESDATE